MFNSLVLLSFAFLATVYGQQVGTNTAETHPKLTWQRCTGTGTCTNQNGAIVLDSNWRWLHTTTGFTNCYDGNTWNTTLCPDGATCAANCALDGADYPGTYGITTSGNALTLKFVTQGAQKNIGSRVYLMATDTQYEMFNLLNSEFTFDVDVSNLPCGLNGAVYFSAMDADGGMAKATSNKAGAKYGTGYCDSQCPHDIKFINGQANVAGWTASPNDTNAGSGTAGACCAEMDIWEANSISAALTPHPCTGTGLQKCSGPADCGDGDNRATGICDKDGCDFNSFRMGDKTFLGPGMTVDTKQKITVVTQFLTTGNSTTGPLTEIRRLYVQNGKVIQNSKTTVAGMATFDSITEDFCTAQKSTFQDSASFQNHGGLKQMGAAMAKGMVLVLSVWDDHAVNMLWLDSDYPTDQDATKPGIARGTCATDSGQPTQLEANAANIQVTYSNIRFGTIGSTYTGSASTPAPPGSSTTTTGSPTTTSSAPQATQTKYGQCGGTGYVGPSVCATGSACKAVSPPYYSQCL